MAVLGGWGFLMSEVNPELQIPKQIGYLRGELEVATGDAGRLQATLQDAVCPPAHMPPLNPTGVPRS